MGSARSSASRGPATTPGRSAASRSAPHRAQEDERLARLIAQIHEGSHEIYGAPRIHAELADEHGVRVSRKRVARLMRAQGITGVSRRGRRKATTRPDPAAPPAPDLVGRDFTATAPDELWVADITYIPTWEGWLFLAAVIDACSRYCVGWSMRDDLRAELVVDALAMAIARRQPRPGLIHHSDSEYVPTGFLAWSDPHSDRRERMCGAVCPRVA